MLNPKILALFLALSASMPTANAGGVVPPNRNSCPQFYEGYLKYKNYAISCTRTRARQMQLVAMFTKMGRPGQASKNSNHVRGCACDLNRRVSEQNQFRRYNGRGHTGNHYSHTGR
jgi:hypothetical protein